MKRKIKIIPKQNQRTQIQKDEIKFYQEGDFNFVEFPFSSSFPVERIFGKEVLSQAPGAMLMERFSAFMPLLFNHNLDKQLGVIEQAWLGSDQRYWVKCKLARTDAAKEQIQNIQDQILMNVSFWYDIKDMRLMSEVDGVPTYEITEYEPLEISFVTVPADYTVGLGRSAGTIDKTTEVEMEVDVPDEPKGADPVDPPASEPAPTEPALVVTEPPPPKEENENVPANVDVDVQRNINLNQGVKVDEKQLEQQRIMAILVLASMHGEEELAKRYVTEGKSAADFALELSKKLGGNVRKINETPLDLTEQEKQKYSLSRAMAAHLNNDWSKAGFEKECSQALMRQMGVEGSKGFFVPNNMKSQVRSPYLAGTANVGGNTVPTQLLSAEFIDIQRARTKVIQAGARVLSGLKGLVAIPRKSGGSSYYWIAENGTVTQTNGTFDQVTLSPKKIGALSYFTRELLVLGDPSIDALIVDDLTKSIAVGQDAGAISGTGSSGQPLGVLNQSGIGSVAIGTNGGALSFDHLIDLETKVADANFDEDTMCYMTNSKQIGNLKKLKDANNNYYWQKADSRLVGAKGEINGYQVHRTNNVPRNLTKGTSSGVCSAVIFGDFSQMLIAQWMPGTEILMNPFGSGFANDAIEVRAVNLIDVALRQPGAFAAITDAT
jgi:HK97 family phage major capsid protein